MDLNEEVYALVKWTHLAQNTIRWRDFVNMVIHCQVIKRGNSVTI